MSQGDLLQNVEFNWLEMAAEHLPLLLNKRKNMTDVEKELDLLCMGRSKSEIKIIRDAYASKNFDKKIFNMCSNIADPRIVAFDAVLTKPYLRATIDLVVKGKTFKEDRVNDLKAKIEETLEGMKQDSKKSKRFFSSIGRFIKPFCY